MTEPEPGPAPGARVGLDPEATPRRRSLPGRLLALLLALAVTAGALVGTASGQSVLVLGIDRREGDRGRSDTLLVVHPRVFGGGLKLLSVPRDTRVELDGVGTAKINAAYPHGGGEAAAAAVGRLLGVPVHGYVVLDFETVRQVVDALGGVRLHVPEGMNYRDPRQDLVIDLEPGLQRLNGDQVLGFLRFRADARGDIGRVERQRAFVRALLGELAAPRSWPRLPAVYRAFRQHAETDLGWTALLRFGAAAAVAGVWGVEEATLPGETASVGGASYWMHDPDAARELIRRMFGP